jgi:hypothetical protein
VGQEVWEAHTVAMCAPAVDVLHRGSCTCGWTVHYDARTYRQASGRAHEHIAEAYEAYLATQGG